MSTYIPTLHECCKSFGSLMFTLLELFRWGCAAGAWSQLKSRLLCKLAPMVNWYSHDMSRSSLPSSQTHRKATCRRAVAELGPGASHIMSHLPCFHRHVTPQWGTEWHVWMACMELYYQQDGMYWYVWMFIEDTSCICCIEQKGQIRIKNRHIPTRHHWDMWAHKDHMDNTWPKTQMLQQLLAGRPCRIGGGGFGWSSCWCTGAQKLGRGCSGTSWQVPKLLSLNGRRAHNFIICQSPTIMSVTTLWGEWGKAEEEETKQGSQESGAWRFASNVGNMICTYLRHQLGKVRR